MAVFINGMGNISPQQSWGDKALLSLANVYEGDRLFCIEPDYSVWIDPKQSRRMSRIIKMGVASASMALQEAGVEKPGAIIAGTGYGCLEDTGAFLNKMIENNEQALNPTPFIQSTHNSIASQIALLLQCQNYNQTYTHGAFSFESALMDAILRLDEFSEKTVLVGGIDEITTVSHDIQKRFGIFRKKSSNNLDLFKTPGKGTLNGEGAAFFLLSADENEPNIGSIENIGTFYKPSENELERGIHDFLSTSDMKISDVDLLLSGRNGDLRTDKKVAAIEEMFLLSSLGVYKHLCGEYPAASSFALWLAVRVIQEKHIPDIVKCRDTGRYLQNILIYNQYFGTHHSLILLKA